MILALEMKTGVTAESEDPAQFDAVEQYRKMLKAISALRDQGVGLLMDCIRGRGIVASTFEHGCKWLAVRLLKFASVNVETVVPEKDREEADAFEAGAEKSRLNEGIGLHQDHLATVAAHFVHRIDLLLPQVSSSVLCDYHKKVKDLELLKDSFASAPSTDQDKVLKAFARMGKLEQVARVFLTKATHLKSQDKVEVVTFHGEQLVKGAMPEFNGRPLSKAKVEHALNQCATVCHTAICKTGSVPGKAKVGLLKEYENTFDLFRKPGSKEEDYATNPADVVMAALTVDDKGDPKVLAALAYDTWETTGALKTKNFKDTRRRTVHYVYFLGKAKGGPPGCGELLVDELKAAIPAGDLLVCHALMPKHNGGVALAFWQKFLMRIDEKHSRQAFLLNSFPGFPCSDLELPAKTLYDWAGIEGAEEKLPMLHLKR